jgi:glycosyltransferase involved in cell wall biosynthesis
VTDAKLAIVHDFLNQYGGAERVVEVLHSLYPDAPIFTTIHDPDALPDSFRRMDVRTSFMQGLPGWRRHFKKYLPLYPAAVRSLDLRGYDVILSSSSAFAKGVRVPPGAKHVCYCYTPMRFVWDRENYLADEPVPAAARLALPAVLAWLRRWDVATSRSVDRFIAISRHIRERIRTAYGRESDVVYPPVDTDWFTPDGGTDDFYLAVSRLNPYKRLDVAVEAFKRLGRRLVVVGRGPDEARLRRLAGPTVEFAGPRSPERLRDLYRRCRAFVFPGREDFGIAPVEAMACGRPVVAFREAGALETVEEGRSGVFFSPCTADALAAAVRRLDGTPPDPAVVRRSAERFGTEVFRRSLSDVLASYGVASRPGVRA